MRKPDMYISSNSIVTAGTASTRSGFHFNTTHDARARPEDTVHARHDHTCSTCRENAAEARRVADSLDALVWDGTPAPQATRILAAARVFSEGTFYLTGQNIDRSA